MKTVMSFFFVCKRHLVGVFDFKQRKQKHRKFISELYCPSEHGVDDEGGFIVPEKIIVYKRTMFGRMARFAGVILNSRSVFRYGMEEYPLREKLIKKMHDAAFSEAQLSKLWDTPEEDDAWKHL